MSSPGDPDAKKDVFWKLKKTLYGLGRSPRHWHKLVDSVLRDIGLEPSAHDPCLYQGVPSAPTDNDPTSAVDHPSPDIAAPTDKPLHLGIYIDDFVYFSKDPAIERRFERLLAAKLKVEFMGTVNWFLGTHFE